MTPRVGTFFGKSITKRYTEEIDPPPNASFLNFITRLPALTALALLAWELGVHAVNETFEEHGKQPPRKNS